MRVGQADRLHRAVAQGFAAAFGHDLDRQAAVEIPGGLALVELGFLGGKQGVDKGLVLRLVHRAVEVGGSLFLGLALVIARLHPGARHVDAVVIEDRRDGVEKGQRLGASLTGNCLAKPFRGERAGGDDPVAFGGQGIDCAVFKRDIGMRQKRRRHRLREGIAIHRERATGGNAMLFGGLHDKAVGGTHFPMQQPDGVLFVIIRAKRVGTDHFGQIAGTMGKGFHLWAHFMNDDRHAHMGGLPCGLGAGHAATDNMKCFAHGVGCRRLQGL